MRSRMLFSPVLLAAMAVTAQYQGDNPGGDIGSGQGNPDPNDPGNISNPTEQERTGGGEGTGTRPGSDTTTDPSQSQPDTAVEEGGSKTGSTTTRRNAPDAVSEAANPRMKEYENGPAGLGGDQSDDLGEAKERKLETTRETSTAGQRTEERARTVRDQVPQSNR